MKIKPVIILLTVAWAALIVACDGRVQRDTWDTDMLQVRDSIDARNFEAAHRLIDQHLATAPDSDTYYGWLVSKNYAWYSAMKDDSFLVTTERIHQYLLGHEAQPNAQRERLWAEWYMVRGVYYAALRGQMDSAIVCTKEAVSRMDGKEKNWGMRIMGLTNLAEFYRQAGQLDKSTDVYLRALHLADSLQVSDNERIAILLGISTAYTFMNDHKSSREWWERTAQMLPRMRTADQFIYYNNRGNDYCFQQQYEAARAHFAKAMSLVKGDDNKKWDYYTSLINLGQVYVSQGKDDSARVVIHQADSFFRERQFAPFIYYLGTEQIELAMLESRTADALKMVEGGGWRTDDALPDMKVPRLKAVERVMEQTGHWKEAYEARTLWQQLNDSIQGANIQMQLSARLMQYEFDKRLVEQQRTIERQQQNSLLTWALLVIALLAIIVLIVVLQLRKRRQRLADLTTRQQIISLRMENIRNRITPHFTYNALTHEMLEQMEGRQVDLDPLTQLLRRGLQQASELQTTLSEELGFVDYYVDIEKRQMGDAFHYVKDIAQNIDATHVHLPAMTLQIFVENAIKHGLRHQGGTLTIRALRQEEATLLEVTDDGVGLSPDYREHTGMRIIRQTIQLLNEQNMRQITFGIVNLQKGCRSWVLLPDDYDYQLKL